VPFRDRPISNTLSGDGVATTFRPPIEDAMFPVSDNIIAAVLFGLFGLLFGSFGNVVIWRVPRGESIVSPPSHCPRCGRPVRWFDNVPVVSWLVLQGRCRDCGEPISVRYPIVEAISGALWAVAGWRWGISLSALVGAIFFYLLLLLAAVDIDTGRLPNPLVAIMAGIGLAAAVLSQLTGVLAAPIVDVAPGGWLSMPLVSALVGCGAGLATSWAIAATYSAVRGRRGLGMGDVKLLGAMGLFLGPYVLMAYLIGNFLGAVWGIALAIRVRGRQSGAIEVRFGPFLAAGAVLTALAGPALWDGYLGLIARLVTRLAS
jgi:leader peptidase (prepilin peptidase)/N-methyltransferase